MRKALTILAAILAITAAPAAELDLSKMKALEPRSIGPAAMSGRVTAITTDPRNHDIIYAGTASGGLWKSPNGGTTWEPIFDDQGSSSIGAVAIDPLNPDVIWVGTGEGNPRNSQNVGDGIYKSVDGGRTWQHHGLEKSEHIHRVLIHPHNTQIVYAGVTGATWSDSQERGVYKTTNGGETWEKVLYVDERTGVGDMVMDPVNPDKLIVAMWEHRRTPAFFTSGGPGSGIHVTYDGGKNWTRLTNKEGLPEGDLGRVGLGIAPSRPNVVYALVEAKKNALYRSEDGGHKWRKINDKPEIGNRPFYYFDIRVAPDNENRIYSIHSGVTYSQDGGKSFENLVNFSKLHSDHHAFWIDPDNPDYMIDGNDGGLGITRDGGETWRFIENLPVGQFYHINVDSDVPYNVYGGLQDNGSFVGPSQVWEGGFGGGGILNSHWQMVSFGDGFDVVPDPTDSRYGYSMSQGGSLYRYDRLTKTSRFIRPPAPEGVTLRFNWNAGIAVDPFQPRTVYYGSQFVHKSPDQGDSWEIISPDLTTNDPERQKQLDSGGLTYDVTNAENNTTIVAIAPSPKRQGVIWVGSDDGLVHVTRDGGKNWKNVTGNIPGLPEGIWVPHIEASKFQEGGAFAVFEDHRRGDWTPYVYKTHDYGSTWTSLVTENIRGYCYVIEQDPVAENLLFLGTEFHLYASIDGGQSWTKWDQGYPTVPTMDLAIHPREPDLVIGTFGRAIWIMDDITPLRVMAQEGAGVMDETLRLFEVAAVHQAIYGTPAGELVPGNAAFRGKNRDRGALITYLINPPDAPDVEKSETDGEGEESEEASAEETEGESDEPDAPAKSAPQKVTIEILDGDKVIRTLKGPTEPGLNRVNWGMDRKSPRFPSRRPPRPDAGEQGGIPVLPGEYTVRVKYGEHEATQTVQVMMDPRLDVSPDELQARNAFFDQMAEQMERVSDSYDRIRKAREKMDTVDKLVKEKKGDDVDKLKEVAKETREGLKQLDEMFFSKQVQGIRRDPTVLTSRLGSASGYVRSSWTSPTPTEREVFEQVKVEINKVTGEVDEFFDGQWKAYEKAVKKVDISPL